MSEEMVEVHLRGFPLRLWQRANLHQEAIHREMEIMRVGGSADSVPNRLLSLIEQYDRQYGEAGGPTWNEIRAAAERGEETMDATFTVPRSAAEAARSLEAMMREVDEYCRAGEHLMTLATPPEMVAFRSWVLGEFTRQIEDGLPARSWSDSPKETRTIQQPADGGNRGDGSETIVFEGALDLATVNDLRHEIQEVRSRSPQEIVVDLTGVGFVDSIGIGLLVTTHNRLEEEGVGLRLVVPPRIKELLRLSGLIDLLRPEDPPGS